MKFATPALDAWRKRANFASRDALWVAACWEACAADLVKERPGCLRATYVQDPLEIRLRAAAARQKPPISLFPWMRATAKEALDLYARPKVEGWMAEAQDALSGEEGADFRWQQRLAEHRRAQQMKLGKPQQVKLAGSWAAFQ